MIEIEQIKLFRSLFNGREDAFAIRWEKGEKSGYMPSYQFDPYHYKIHKAKGGTLANTAHQSNAQTQRQVTNSVTKYFLRPGSRIDRMVLFISILKDAFRM